MLNISFRYHTAFTFCVFHEYYQDELATDLLMIPSSYSSDKARRLGMIIKQSNNQLKLLFEEEKTEMFLSLPAEELRFSFFIYSKNSYFYNFTQLPLEAPSGKLLYFSNQNEATQGKLSKADFVTEKDYVERSLIKDPFPSEHPTKQPIAFVEIFLSDFFQKTDASLSDFSEISSPEYSIRFAARKTYWKYAIVPQHRKLDHQAQIIHGDGLAASFTRKENETLLNNQQATIFISDEPLMLKQRTEYALKLTQKDKVSKAHEIIPRLPVPAIDMIKPESRAADAKIYSEVVVYI
jgi:hypothetical protein